MENIDQDTLPRQMQASKVWTGSGLSAVWFQQRFTVQDSAPQGWFSLSCQARPMGELWLLGILPCQLLVL